MTAPTPVCAQHRALILSALMSCEVADEATCRDALLAARFYPRRARELPSLSPRELVAYAALAGRARGITLGDAVYVRQDAAEPAGLPLALVAHEIAHVVQFRRDGASRFLARYLGQYAINLARGMPERQAYLQISYEVEARRVEAALPG